MLNVLLFVSTVLIWGSTWYGIKLQIGIVPIEWSLVYRFGSAAIILFGIALLTGNSLRLTKGQHGAMIIMGILLFGLNYSLNYAGTQYMASGLVALAFSTLTPMNVLNNAILLKRRSDILTLTAVLLGLGGVALAFYPEIIAEGFDEKTLFGLMLVLAAAYVASLGNIATTNKTAMQIPFFSKMAWGMLYGTLYLLVFALFTGKAPAFDMSYSYVGSLLYLSIIGSVLAFSIYLLLIARIGVDRAGYMAVMIPVVALLISTVLEGYQWSVHSVAGVLMVLTGNILILKKRR